MTQTEDIVLKTKEGSTNNENSTTLGLDFFYILLFYALEVTGQGRPQN